MLLKEFDKCARDLVEKFKSNELSFEEASTQFGLFAGELLQDPAYVVNISDEVLEDIVKQYSNLVSEYFAIVEMPFDEALSIVRVFAEALILDPEKCDELIMTLWEHDANPPGFPSRDDGPP